jgi:hypothetical protein
MSKGGIKVDLTTGEIIHLVMALELRLGNANLRPELIKFLVSLKYKLEKNLK